MDEKCTSFILQNNPKHVGNQIAKHEDLESQKSFQVFVNAIKAPSTRKYYVRDLYVFLEFAKVSDFNSLASLSTDVIQDHLENYVLYLRKRGVQAVRSRVCGPELFFEMNKKLYHKKVLHKLFPSDDKVLGGGVAYTNEDILAMLDSTKKLRTKAVIHFLASTGIRPGAFADPPFQKKHLVKMSDGCYGIKVYDESREGYWAFLTPEAVKALNQYLESRKINGEIITDESYLFVNYKSGSYTTEYLNLNGITQMLKRVVLLSAIKRIKVNGKNYDKALSYGFRKRFNTILKLNNEINSNVVEKLMAHKRGLDGRYLVPTIDECFNEFKKAIFELTINPKQRQKVKIENLEKEKSELKIKEKQIDDLQERFEDFKEESLNEIEKLKWTNEIYSIYFETGKLPKIETRGDKTRLHFKSLDELKKNSKKDLK